MGWLFEFLIQLLPDFFGFAVAKDAKENRILVQEAVSCGCFALIIVVGAGSIALFAWLTG